MAQMGFGPYRVAAVGGVLAVALASCSSGGTPAPAARVLVGDVSGSDIRLGIAATADNARAFFCGGASSFATRTHWFNVPIAASGAVDSTKDTAAPFVVNGMIGASAASGTITLPDGTMSAFQASAVTAGTIAGVYEAVEPCGRVSLIVSQELASAQPTGQGACVPPAGAGPSGSNPILQVNPIMPLARAADGTIPVVVAGETSTTLVEPAAAPAP